MVWTYFTTHEDRITNKVLNMELEGKHPTGRPLPRQTDGRTWEESGRMCFEKTERKRERLSC
jgi:hypothetical protein